MVKIFTKGVLTIGLILFFSTLSCVQQQKKQHLSKLKPITQSMNYNKLTPEEQHIIINKGTERPFTGALLDNKAEGTYICKQCNAPLYHSKDKFESHCGWPSFDDEIEDAVKRVPDADGRRTEILCANCNGHLGHVFKGEGYTLKNTRHCVNSLSMSFVPKEMTAPTQQLDTAYFASGCFWGTEYHFMKAKGVQKTTVGYMGGHLKQPTYKEVCTGKTGHVEVTEVIYDTTQMSYEALVKLFFETHDFTQTDGQGPDIGSQYLSVIFYQNDQQKNVAKKIIDLLTQKGYKVATTLRPATDTEFWEAEEYHQAYYDKKNGTPYCHSYKKIF